VEVAREAILGRAVVEGMMHPRACPLAMPQSLLVPSASSGIVGDGSGTTADARDDGAAMLVGSGRAGGSETETSVERKPERSGIIGLPPAGDRSGSEAVEAGDRPAKRSKAVLGQGPMMVPARPSQLRQLREVGETKCGRGGRDDDDDDDDEEEDPFPEIVDEGPDMEQDSS
jgi:hypothetical protein